MRHEGLRFLPHISGVGGLIPTIALCEWYLHVLPVPEGFPPSTPDMCVLGLSVVSEIAWTLLWVNSSSNVSHILFTKFPGI